MHRYCLGVDDNGAGVAAMLEVVRQLSYMNKNGVTRRNTIVFAGFDLEEYGGKTFFILSYL